MRTTVSILLLALVLASPGPSAADNGSRWDEIRESLFGDRRIAEDTGILSLTAPPRAHDAALVPVSFEAAFPQTTERRIKTVTLIVDENPMPMAGRFHFTTASGRAAVSTRIRINAYTHIRAVAETGDGELHMVKRYVKASGGCSAPAGKDPEAALAHLGRMKLRRLEPVVWGQPNSAQVLVSHPNHTGMQMDQVTRHYVLAHFVERMEVRYGNEAVLTVDSNFSLSENPSVRFRYVPPGPDLLSVRVTDSEGQVFARSWPIPSVLANETDRSAALEADPEDRTGR